jgi:hypothetical protein
MEVNRTVQGRGGRVRGRLVAAAAALIGAGVLAVPAQADFPWAPLGDPQDPHTFKVAPPTVPNEFSSGVDWKFAATPETSPTSTTVNNQPDELCGVRGASIADNVIAQPGSTCAPNPVHTGWESSTGRPDVTIAVLDSGIEWNDQGAMTDLRAKVRLNPGELPAPLHDMTGTSLTGGSCASGWHDATGGDYDAQGGTRQSGTIPYDINGDGVFNVLDYACDSRVATVVHTSTLRHGPANFLTPEDLIIAFGTDGQDHDGNGFKNDIAGWNFVDDNNNPYDDVQYAHGTGEALDSNAEANNGGDVGSCPNCTVLPLRVGESFIADVNRFAQAVLYATDNRVSIVQEALGTLNNSLFSRQAIDYAYNHGVTIIASAADEAAEHHNQPGSLPHTIVVNSVNQYTTAVTQAPPSYLQFNGCTNFSTKITIAVPSSSCSSEATGKGAGVAGLIYSAALNAHELGNLPASGDCTRTDGTPCVVTPNEVRQLMGSGEIGSASPADAGSGGQADDVNFAAQPEPSCAPAPAPNCTDPNHDMVFAPDQNGGLVGPAPDTRRYPARKGFDEFYGYGRLNAYKAVSAAALGKIPPEADITYPDWFQQVDPGPATQELDGYVNARGPYTCHVDVAPGAEPNNALTTASPPGDFKTVASNWCDGSTVRTSSFRGALASLDLGDLKNRFPATAGSFDEREPGLSVQTSNGRPNTMPYAFTVRVVVTTGTGPSTMTGEDRRQLFLHRDQDMLSGFPMELRTDGASSPLLVDLDGDNRNELVVATSDGLVHAFRRDGSELPGWPVHTDSLSLHPTEPAYATGGIGTDHYNAVLGGLAAGDLFHDGRLEIVADDNGGKMYAWDAQGNQVFKREANPAYSGAPLPATPLKTERLGPRDRVEHGFLAAPVLAHLDGNPNGPLDIIAAGEDRHVYAWHADGSTVAGFPVLVADPDKVAAVDPVTNEITFKNVSPNPGRVDTQGKIVDTPAVADITGSGKPSIIVGTNEEYPVNTGDEGGMNAGNFNTTSLGALGQTGLLTFGNTRLYEIKPDGNASGDPFLNPPQKLGIINAGLLPDVGEGVDGSPVVANLSCPGGGGGPKIGVIPAAGPGYIFNPDGSSCYGKDPTNGHDNALATDFSASATSAKYDTPAIPAVGYPSFGTFDNGATTTMFAPAAGLLRALDLVINEYQGGQDFIAAWDPTSGQFSPGFPSPVNDLSFLSGETVGDILGNPATQEVVGGTASLDLAAVNVAGQPANTNWPKLTGDWTIATPVLGSFGTLDTDVAAHKDVVSITRMGTLSVYGTPASACSPSSWPNFHHDIANSGDYSRDAVPPGVPMNAAISGATLAFLAPGNDLLCGTADHYQLATSDSPITPENFASAQPIANPPAPQAAGTPESITLPAGTQRYVAVRAVDGQGNIGLPASVDTGIPAPAGGTPGSGPLVSPSGPGTPITLSPVTAPAAPKKVGGVAGFSFLGLPPSGPCLSKRSFVIHLRAPAGQRLARVRVYVNRRQVRVLAGRRLTAPVDLRGLPRGRFEVRIVARTTRGRTLSSARHYHTCTPKRKARHRKTAKRAARPSLSH